MKISNPHVLALPYPAQGHVLPLMELSLCLAKHGFRITFVNNEFIHERLAKECKQKGDLGDQIGLVSLPDWLDPSKDKDKLRRTREESEEFMQQKLEELIAEINGDGGGEPITCIIADYHTGWALKVAAKMGIRRVCFCTTAATFFAWKVGIPKLIRDGIINSDGTPVKEDAIQLSPVAPAMNTKNFPWARLSNLTMQKSAFEFFSRNSKATKVADMLICNSAYELEPAAFDLAPGIIPVGPLQASNRSGNSVGQLWEEDSSCLKWLDQQPTGSVIYVAFGSFAILNKTQFHQLALGLEICNMTFLWVVRTDASAGYCLKDAYPQGFVERVGSRGKIVEWAPQQKVLSHPSVACFLSHCGWNSVVEGVNNGVPFLCWPSFADHFLNESYICDDWKVGLRLSPDETGLVSSQQIKNKLDQLLHGDKGLRARALNLKHVIVNTVGEGGSSYNNFKRIVEWLKE